MISVLYAEKFSLEEISNRIKLSHVSVTKKVKQIELFGHAERKKGQVIKELL